MASNTMHVITLLTTIAFSTMRPTNSAWITTNVSHFCEVANNCIISEAASVTVTVVEKSLRQRKKDVCTAHQRYCDPLPKGDGMEAALIHEDKKAFCHLILRCYKDSLIIGPKVDISQWCPYAQFCNQHPSAQIDDKYINNSCCLPCSCEPSCGASNNCCYSNNSSYNAVESEGLKCTRIIGNSLSLYMRDTCLDGNACRYSDELIVPASSEDKQRIYISRECGECNNASDVIEWEVLQSCKSECDHFIRLPGQVDVQWLKNFKCDTEPSIQTCDPRYEHKAVIELCHTVNAKVIVNRMNRIKAWITVTFANIFCVACNFYFHYRPTKTCSTFDSSTFGKKSPGSLTILLDMTLDRMLIQNSQQGTGPLGDTCPAYMMNNVGKPGCRRVFCPKGMARVKDGSCKYIGKLWYSMIPVLNIRLLPREGAAILAHMLRNISSNYNVKQWLISPCLSWEEDDIQYGVAMVSSGVSKKELVVEIVVKILRHEGDITPATFIPKWARCLDEPWVMIFGTSSYMLSPSIYPGSQISPGYQTIQRTIPTARTHVILSKVYFCDQIELSTDEYQSLNGDQIRLLHTNVTLGAEEYDGSYICVEDYDPQSIHDQTNRAAHTCSNILVICLWIAQIVTIDLYPTM